MTLQFRNNWNVAPPHFAGAPDADIIPILSPDEDSVRVVFHEASINGGFSDARVLRMIAAALNARGPIVSVRSGAHQVEDGATGGFRLHIGTLFEGVNFHLNIAQTMTGRVYITSVSWGAPNTPGYGSDARTGSAPP
jgi:hypothetical protein